MRAPASIPQPFDEARRLAALHALEIVDTAPEQDYDSVVVLAAQILDMPSAFIALVDSDRQWLKARRNAPIDQTSRAIAFCDLTIRSPDMLVVDDAARDPRFSANPLVTGEAAIRFYAGVPLHAPGEDGSHQPVGTLCVVDSKPRTLDDRARAALHHLAILTEALIDARAAAVRARDVAALAERRAADVKRADRTFRQAERLAQIGSWRIRLADDTVEWSEGVYRIHGLPTGDEHSIERAMDFYPPHARATISAALASAIETRRTFDVETDFVTARGELRRVRSVGEPELVEGRLEALVGVFQDVTERHALEEQLRRSAHRDELTGIANRAAFNQALEKAITGAQADGTPLMLALIDLDGFKQINDTLGHLAGDDVLKTMARRLEQPHLASCFAARIGGDEFALIVPDPALLAMPADFAARLQDDLCTSISMGGLTMAASGTVGTAMLGRHDSIRDFVHAADTDLYAAKRRRVGNRRRGDPGRRAA